jgi:hypothetical protein
MVWLKWSIARPSSILTKSGNSLKTVDETYPVELLYGDSGPRQGITAVVSHSANDRLRCTTKQRGYTVTALANSAPKKWLGGKHAA